MGLSSANGMWAEVISPLLGLAQKALPQTFVLVPHLLDDGEESSP